MRRSTLIACISLVVACAVAGGDEYDRAYRADVFFLAKDGHSHVSIGVDTTNPELLKLAIALQETIFVLGGARPPIENIGAVSGAGSTNMMWRMIYFVQDLRSMGEQPLYTVSWEFHQPGCSLNCGKRLRIAYCDVTHARDAIETVLMKQFGTGLIDKIPTSGRRRILCIPVEKPQQNLGVVVRDILKKRSEPSNEPSEATSQWRRASMAPFGE